MDLSSSLQYSLLALLYLVISGSSFVSAITANTPLPSSAPVTATSGRATECLLDLVFVLDGSGSISSMNFASLKNWTSSIVKEFDVETGAVQIGVIQYAGWDRTKPDLNNQSSITTEVALGQYSSHQQLSNAIAGIRQHGGGTYTAQALNKTVLDFKASTRWESNSTVKVLVLITDGRTSSAGVGLLPETAEYVRSLGIIPFVIGIGSYDIMELRTIASGNLASNERVYTVHNFADLSTSIKSLKTDIMKSVVNDTTTQPQTKATTITSSPLPPTSAYTTTSASKTTPETTTSAAYQSSCPPPTATTTTGSTATPLGSCTARYKELLRQYEEILQDYKESYNKWKAEAKKSGILCTP